ncbi:hypothetical protein [Echinicola sediminis]
MMFLTVAMLQFESQKLKKYLPVLLFSFGLLALLYFGVYIEGFLSLIGRYEEMNVDRFGNVGGEIFSLPIWLGAIPRILFLFFIPAPGLGSFHQVFLTLSTILQIIFFPFLWWSLKNRKIDFRLKISFVMLFLGVALTTATFRHVMMYLPFGIVLVCLELQERGFLINTKYVKIVFTLIISFAISLAVAFTY